VVTLTQNVRPDSTGSASDTLADSRVQKPKNFLAFFSRLLSHPSAAKRKRKGNFWFCFATNLVNAISLFCALLKLPSYEQS
jgi:hypothetical protein